MLVLGLACAHCWVAGADGVWHVDGSNVSPAQNGTSWSEALTTIQPTIDAAHAAGGEAWVATGTYFPARDNRATTGAARPDLQEAKLRHDSIHRDPRAE